MASQPPSSSSTLPGLLAIGWLGIPQRNTDTRGSASSLILLIEVSLHRIISPLRHMDQKFSPWMRIYHHLQEMKAMSLLPNSWIKWSQLSCLWCDQLLVPNFEPVVVGWIGSTIGVALHTLAHYALERPKTWFAYKNYTKKQYSSGINIRKTYKVQRSYTEHENNIIFICVWKSRYFGLVNNLNPNLGQLPLKKTCCLGTIWC